MATPVVGRGEGEADLKYVFEVCKDLSKIIDRKDKPVIVTKSTVPIGTGKNIISLFKEKHVIK